MQFDFDAPRIELVAQSAAAATIASPAPAVDFESAVWSSARRASRMRIEGLAQIVEPRVAWDAVVLPPPQRASLELIVDQVQQRATVYDDWGFGGLDARGLGITALFAGPSGTGKTLAAEAIAQRVGVDLYRVDLSAIVSKYIGETEKNLRRIFEAAEEGGAILLFDEADALFGKRSEVKDSHDRHANVEVSYLLQRMEAYRGVAILTTNVKDILDRAFLRRLRFVVAFPFPDAAHRETIWRGVFPAGTPHAELDYGRLAQFDVAGGSIKNIALNAAFLAAAGDGALTMAHLLDAARIEYAKLEKPFPPGELSAWAISSASAR
jgi:SpoVK/Ycf46/Vps4 family AAA+-type ATPase